MSSPALTAGLPRNSPSETLATSDFRHHREGPETFTIDRDAKPRPEAAARREHSDEAAGLFLNGRTGGRVQPDRQHLERLAEMTAEFLRLAADNKDFPIGAGNWPRLDPEDRVRTPYFSWTFTSATRRMPEFTAPGLGRTLPTVFTVSESLDVGADLGLTASEHDHHRRPFAFDGRIGVMSGRLGESRPAVQASTASITHPCKGMVIYVSEIADSRERLQSLPDQTG